MSEQAFKQLVDESGVPTTSEALKTQWQQVVTDSGSEISNDSKYSPFWRIVSELVTKPVLWLVNDLLITHILPQFFLKTVGEGFIELWSWSYNVERKAAQTAQGNIVFSRVDVENDVPIPAGTVINSVAINDVVYQLTTDADASFLAGAETTHATATAVSEGSAYNLEGGMFNALAVPIDGITVINADDWLLTLGANIEDIEALRHRVRAKFNTLSHYHTDGVYRSIISEYSGVDARAIWFEHTAPRGPASVNAYVLFELTAYPVALLATINNAIATGYHGHGDDLLVLAMPETQHNVVATCWLSDELLDSQKTAVLNSVDAAIRAAFRENTSFLVTLVSPQSRFSFSRLGLELHTQIEGLVSIEFDLNDIVSVLAVPRLNNLIVTDGGA